MPTNTSPGPQPLRIVATPLSGKLAVSFEGSSACSSGASPLSQAGLCEGNIRAACNQSRLPV